MSRQTPSAFLVPHRWTIQHVARPCLHVAREHALIQPSFPPKLPIEQTLRAHVLDNVAHPARAGPEHARASRRLAVPRRTPART
jgi:hypothetical protein